MSEPELSVVVAVDINYFLKLGLILAILCGILRDLKHKDKSNSPNINGQIDRLRVLRYVLVSIIEKANLRNSLLRLTVVSANY